MADSQHSGPYLAAEGETWVLKADYDALELSHAAAIAQRDRYRSAHARLEEQFDAMEKVARLLWQYYLLPLPPEKAALVREVLDTPLSNPARELAPPAPRDNETGGSLVETPDPASRSSDG